MGGTGRSMSKPVRPRHAASLVILRGEGGDTEVLLGRREPKHRFMPNVFVFPGGRLDRTDSNAPAAAELRPEVAASLQRHSQPRQARGLAVAAVRETFEETGLRFGDVENGSIRPALDRLDFIARAITPPQSPIRFHARFFVSRAEDASGPLRGNGELLDLHWAKLDDALKLPLVDVTEFVLEEVVRRIGGDRPDGIPLFSYRHGRAIVRYQ